MKTVAKRQLVEERKTEERMEAEELEVKQRAVLENDFVDEEPPLKKRSSKGVLSSNLTRNENIFIYSMVIFDVSFHLFQSKDDTVYLTKFEECMELMTDVCNLPVFDYQRKEELLCEVKRRARKYQHTLKLSVVSTTGIEKLTSRAHEDQVFLQFACPSMKRKMQLFQTHAGGTWMPSFQFVSKRFNSLFIPICNKRVNATTTFTIKLVIKRCKRNVGGSVAQAMCLGLPMPFLTEKIVVGSADRQFSQLNPQDDQDIFTFKYQETVVSVCVRYTWVLRAPIFKGGYYHFRRHWKIHGEIFEQFLRRMWRRRSLNNNQYAQCSEEANSLGVAVPQDLLPLELRRRNKPWQLPYSLSNVVKRDIHMHEKIADAKKFCICSEWCNIDSFYYHNALARFILCQNQRLFVVPDNLIVPHHFRAVASLISQKSYYCTSLLSSILQLLYEYLHGIYADEVSTVSVHFWRSYPGSLINDGYYQLRQWLVKPESFKLVRKPFEKCSHHFVYFVQAISWLTSVAKFGKDSKLEKKVRFKFQDVFTYWVDIALDNPSLHAAQHTIRVDYFVKVSEKKDGQKGSRSSACYMVKMSEKDLKEEETREKLHSGITTLTETEKSCTVLCSNCLSLVHQVRDFLLQIEKHVPFYLFDKELYRNESMTARTLDSLFCEKQPVSQFNIETIWGRQPQDFEESFVRQHYTLNLYSTALDIQSFIIRHTCFTFHKEFQYEINLQEIKFFTSNDWIENPLANLGKLFPNTAEMKDAIGVCFQKSYSQYWIAVDELGEKGVTLAQALIYEARTFAQWYSNKPKDDIITKTTAEIFQMITSCVDHAKTYLKSQLEAYHGSATDITKPQSALIFLTLKACFFNVVSLTVAILSNSLQILEQKKGHMYPIIFPAWFQLFEIPQKTANLLKSLQNTYAGLTVAVNVAPIVQRTLERINLVFSLLYVKLGNWWFQEIDMYKDQKELKNLLVLVGLPLIDRYSSAFKVPLMRKDFSIRVQQSNEKLIQTIRGLGTTTDVYISKTWRDLFSAELQSLEKIKAFEEVVNLHIPWDTLKRRPSLSHCKSKTSVKSQK